MQNMDSLGITELNGVEQDAIGGGDIFGDLAREALRQVAQAILDGLADNQFR